MQRDDEPDVVGEDAGLGEGANDRAVEPGLAQGVGAAVVERLYELLDDIGESGCVHGRGYAPFEGIFVRQRLSSTGICPSGRWPPRAAHPTELPAMDEVSARSALPATSGTFGGNRMLLLVDILRLSGVALDDWKIHFATTSDTSPLDAFLGGTFKEWQEHQTRRNFECSRVLSLIQLGPDRWLFAGVYAVDGREAGTITAHRYNTTNVPVGDELVGRIVVRFSKSFRQSYVHGAEYGPQLEVQEILPQRLAVEDFPGFRRVRISHERLRLIVRDQLPSWRAALSSARGVYLVADTKVGGLYVGSACGVGGFWQRWQDYVSTGHAGNLGLRALLAEHGDAHPAHFQYSILEVAANDATNDEIVSREQHWKDVLLSRDRGLNCN